MRLEMRGVIWNFWNLKLFQTHDGGCLFETFRWDLKWDVLLETFKTFQTFQTHHEELVIWNFHMRLEMRCAIWNLWNFSTFSKPCHESCLFETFRLDLKQDMLFEMRCAIWNFWNFSTFSNPSWEGCLFETFRWDLKKRCYLKLLKLETLQLKLFKTFDVSFKDKKVSINPESRSDQFACS